MSNRIGLEMDSRDGICFPACLGEHLSRVQIVSVCSTELKSTLVPSSLGEQNRPLSSFAKVPKLTCCKAAASCEAKKDISL